MKKFRVAIIGLGQISQGYDYSTPLGDDSQVFTHAQAFSLHTNFELVAGIDPDKTKQQQFADKFKTPTYGKLSEFTAEADVYVIASTTNTHFQIFQEVLLRNPKAILCEKPLSINIQEAKEMVDVAEAKNIPLLVNYFRRFEPGILSLRSRIQENKFGEIYKGRVWYSKGIYNNGSHFIDLLQYLLGDCSDVQLINTGRKWQNIDPEPDFCLHFGEAKIHFLCAREENFSLAEFELIGTKGRIQYVNAGEKILAFPTVADPQFPGYTILSTNPEEIPNDFSRFQWHTVNHLAQFLQGRNNELNSNGRTALSALQIIEKLLSNGKYGRI